MCITSRCSPTNRKWPILDSRRMRTWLCNCQVRHIFLLLLVCLIQVIAEDSPVGDLIMKHVDPGYKHCFLRAFSKRNLTEYDVELNGIYDGAYDEAREFVKDYENILSRKRNMTPKVQCFYVPSFRCLTQTNGDRCAKLLKCCSIKRL